MHDLVTAYVEAIKGCGLRPYVVVAIFTTFIGLLDWLEDKFRCLLSSWLQIPGQSGDASMIFGIPSWTVALLILFLSFGLLMLRHAATLHLQIMPKFKAYFDLDNGGLTQTIYENNGKFDDCKYIRLTVKNLAKVSVKECVAHITNIYSINQDRTIWNDDPLPLRWSLTHELETKIHTLTKKYIDVAIMRKNDTELLLATQVPYRLKERIPLKGKLLLTIVVTCGGLSKEAKILIDTDGTFKSLSAEAG